MSLLCAILINYYKLLLLPSNPCHHKTGKERKKGKKSQGWARAKTKDYSYLFLSRGPEKEARNPTFVLLKASDR